MFRGLISNIERNPREEEVNTNEKTNAAPNCPWSDALFYSRKKQYRCMCMCVCICMRAQKNT